MSIPRILRLLVLLLLPASPVLRAQVLDYSVTLDDGDAASPDLGFGVTLSRDGVHAYATIAGDVFGPNNADLARIDVVTGSQINTGPTQAYPEDAAITYDALGAARHVYVSNSTTGSVSCLTPALVPVVNVPLPTCFGGSSYPFGLLVSPDQTRLYVTTLAGCGDVHVVDCDPASGTFNTVLGSFVVPGGGGRPSWAAYPVMVIPTTTYDAAFTLSTGGFAVVDVLNTASQASYQVSAPIANHYAFATECVVVPGGRVLLSIGGEIFPTVYECSVATGAVLRTLNLNTVTGIQLHGLAVNPDQTLGVVTSLNGGESVFFDLATFTVAGVHDHGSTSKPNDAVFTPDGSRVVVSLQGAARVDVLKKVPGYALELAAPSTAAVGTFVSFTIDNCEAGQPFAIYASLAGAGPQQVGPFTVYLTDPVFPLHAALGDVNGDHSVSFFVPSVPGLPGLTVATQAGTVDRDGAIRLSNGVQTLIQ